MSFQRTPSKFEEEKIAQSEHSQEISQTLESNESLKDVHEQGLMESPFSIDYL